MNKLSKRDKKEKRQRSSPTDKVPGGYGQFTKPEDVDTKELEMGIEVEYEHTPNTEMSQDIALDHLTEIPDYYTRLEKMEEEAKEEGKFNEVKTVSALILGLAKIANMLDKKGAFEEADEIDILVKKVAGMSAINTLIRALKDNDIKKVRSLMSHISASDLQLTEEDFRNFMKRIYESDLEGAREILGVTSEKEDPELGRIPVSKHLKDIFTPDKEIVTVRDIVEGRVKFEITK